jgi:hypothetical protein
MGYSWHIAEAPAQVESETWVQVALTNTFWFLPFTLRLLWGFV